MAAPSPTPASAPVSSPRTVRWLPSVFQPTFEELAPRTRTDRTRRDWIADLIITAIGLLFGIGGHLAAVDQAGAPGGFLVLLDWLVLPAAMGALFWRRRWPLQVLAVVAVLNVATQSVGFATLVAVFAVAAYTPPTVALSAVALVLATAPVSAWLWTGTESFWAGLIFAIAFTIGTAAWGMFTGTRRQLLVTLHERARRAEDEQALRVMQARQQERTRIAREMHDVLAHRMSLLSIHAGALEFRPDAPPADVARAAGVIRATAHEALEELRAVIGVLRVEDLTMPIPTESGTDDPTGPGEVLPPEPPQPTLSALPELVDGWRAAGARIDLALDVDPALVPTAMGRTAYRLVQEGLTNASKHAPGARISVAVEGVPGGALTVAVTNPLALGTDRLGIPGIGVGLVGLRERAELAGGTFSAGPDPRSRSFHLTATLPWSDA